MNLDPRSDKYGRNLSLLSRYSFYLKVKNKEDRPDESGPPVIQIWAEPNSSFKVQFRKVFRSDAHPLCDFVCPSFFQSFHAEMQLSDLFSFF